MRRDRRLNRLIQRQTLRFVLEGQRRCDSFAAAPAWAKTDHVHEHVHVNVDVDVVVHVLAVGC